MKNITPAQWAVIMTLSTSLIAILSPEVDFVGKVILSLVAIALYCISFLSIVSITKAYTKNSTSLQGFMVLYIDVIFLFASAYFFASIIDSEEEVIYGVKQVCMKNQCYNGVLKQSLDITMAFLDCIYLSILTMTTSGDTSIGVKNFWGRSLIGIQLITTAYISIVGLAQYFSKQSSEELMNVKNSIMQAIQDQDNKPLNRSKASIFEKIISCIKPKH